MKVLIVGTTGQVGNALMRAPWPAGFRVSGTTRTELDMADAGSIRNAIKTQSPDLVVNATAYTAVDKAESDEITARQVNAHAVGILAESCATAGAALIHISTDYVFDGRGDRPYVETDPIAPLGVYGKTKVEGEEAVRKALDRHVIIRTSWVYSDHGANFVKTMLRLGAARDELSVVADQYGAPTSAFDIAGAIIAIARAIEAARLTGRSPAWGTYHFSGAGETTWHGFAEHIFSAMQRRTGRRPALNPIPTSSYPTPAKRPANSRLDCSKIESTFGIARRPWQQSLDDVLALLASENHPGTA